MAQIIAVISLGLLLSVAALVWSGERPMNVNAGADPASVSVSEVMLKVDAKSLPAQEFDDQTMVFPARHG